MTKAGYKRYHILGQKWDKVGGFDTYKLGRRMRRHFFTLDNNSLLTTFAPTGYVEDASVLKYVPEMRQIQY